MAVVEVTKSSRDTKVGIILSTTKSGLVRVKEIKDGSLFQSTKLKVGMIVNSVNGKSLDGLTSLEATNIIKEADGMVSLEVSKPMMIPNGAPKGGMWGTFTHYPKEKKNQPDDSCGDVLCCCALLLLCGCCDAGVCSPPPGVQNEEPAYRAPSGTVYLENGQRIHGIYFHELEGRNDLYIPEPMPMER